jgi:UDP-N-acetylmuramoyl-tripeptide--D-alanyl-D-alanine ligase
MKALAEKLPVDFHVEYKPNVEELQPVLLSAVKPGDAIMIKSSKGTGFSRIVAALLDKYQAFPEREDRS